MSQRPKRKAAPKVILDVEGISSEEEGEAPPPENEEELLGKDEDSDELVEESLGNEASDLSGDDIPMSDEVEKPVRAKGKAKSKVAKAPKAKAAGKKAKAAKAPKKIENVEEDSNEEEERSEGDDSTVKRRGDAKVSSKTSGDATERHFKIVPESIEPKIDLQKLSANGGRFKGNPRQVALKAFRQIALASGQENCEFTFSIIETTRGSKNKTFPYTGSREKLKKPHEITKSGAKGKLNFDINYSTTVKAYKPDAEPKKASKEIKSSSRAKQARSKAPPAKIEEEIIEEDSNDAAAGDDSNDLSEAKEEKNIPAKKAKAVKTVKAKAPKKAKAAKVVKSKAAKAPKKAAAKVAKTVSAKTGRAKRSARK